jgi:dihydroorotate dehydrogenase (NAD+) catalytic subunit
VILNASGCLDALTAPDVAGELDAFVTKTVTPLPRGGNEPVRIAETDVGMLNSIGLANPGIDEFVEEVLPRLAELDRPIWVSVGGFSAEDYASLCVILDRRDEVAAVELNVSCPNVAEPAGSVAEIVKTARAATSKTLYTKLSLVNTIRGLALDGGTLAPILSTATGGFSGPALRPIALAAVFTCYRATGLPIVAMGGISSGRHALESIAAGASACALGTILFSDPGAPARIRSELDVEAQALGFENPLAARAAAHGEKPVLPLRHVA